MTSYSKPQQTDETAEQLPPVTITILRSGFPIPGPRPGYGSRIGYRHEVITLTPSQVLQTRNRRGESWLDLSEDQQLARWGEVRFKLGAHAPEGAVIGDDDSGLQSDRREKAMDEARRIPNERERIAAIEAVNQEFGRPTSQWTLSQRVSGD